MSHTVFGPGFYSNDTTSGGSRIIYVEGSTSGLVWKGDYIAGYSYNPNDMVRYNEIIYLCTQSANTVIPTDSNYFAKMVSMEQMEAMEAMEYHFYGEEIIKEA